MGKKNRKQGDIVIAGVGGQGVVLAGNILTDVCLAHGLDVKKAEVHGMSQRGGAVSAQVRFAPEVHSVVIEPGHLDWVVGFEWAEALRWLPLLAKKGTVFVSTERILPPAAQRDRVRGEISYPLELLQDPRVKAIDAVTLAREAGNVKTAGIVLLGALSLDLGFGAETWQNALERWVPAKALEANLKAFDLGRRWEDAQAPPAVQRPPAIQSRFALAIEPSWCKGCGICVDVCPERLWKLDEQGIARMVDQDLCTGCLLCEKLCPDLAIEVSARGAHKDLLGATGGKGTT